MATKPDNGTLPIITKPYGGVEVEERKKTNVAHGLSAEELTKRNAIRLPILLGSLYAYLQKSAIQKTILLSTTSHNIPMIPVLPHRALRLRDLSKRHKKLRIALA